MNQFSSVCFTNFAFLKTITGFIDSKQKDIYRLFIPINIEASKPLQTNG